jgi:PAS domain S-box-containing protein
MATCILNRADTELQPLVFHNSPLPYLVYEAHTGLIIKANSAAAAFLGRTAKQLQAACFPDFLVTEAGTTMHGLLKKLRSGEAHSFFQSCKTSEGIRLVQVFASIVSDAEPLVGVMLVAVTNRNTPDEREDLLANMIDETSDVLTAADLEFKPITWSKAAERIYGLRREQVLGRSLRDFIEVQYPGTTREEVRAIAHEQGEWRGEMSFTRPTDGKKLTLLITFKLMKDKRGKPLHYFISGTDITDRKEAEAKLLESENRFREVADSAPVGIWMSEVENKVIYFNKPLADFTGVQKDGFNKAIWVSLIHPDDRHAVLEKFRDHFIQQLPVTLMYRFKRACGAYRWVQDTGTPRFLSDGTFLGYIGSIIDIHDQKLREEQLQYQATLMDNVLDSVVTTDMNFVVQSCNKVAEEIYGFTAAAIIGKRMPELAHFTYIGTTKEIAFAELTQKGVWKGEIDVTVQGQERNFLFTVTYVTGADGNRMGIMALGREITDRKRAEKKLQESELFYRSLIADSLDGMLLTDVQGTITFSSPSIKPILGFEEAELLHKNAFEFVHPDDHALAMEAFLNEVSKTSVVRSVEIRILKKDGTWLWCLVRGNNLLNNPHVGSIVISLHDDSLRKKATDALRESEQRFRTLIRDLRLGVLLEDAGGNILMHNKATADMFGLSEATFNAEAMQAVFQKAILEDGSVCKREAWPAHQAAQTKKPVSNVVVGIYKNGNLEPSWLLVNANPVLDESENLVHIITSFKDITERKKLMQEQINQHRLLTQATIDGQEQERKEIGKELHDNIGQQLTTTKLYLDMAKASHSEQCGKMVDRALKNISAIINEVRAMSHALVPSTLGDIGLIESVHELAESIRMVQDLQIDFQHYDFSEEHIPENGKLMLYRIIQEALNNIVKHAAATSVNINLVRTERMILLEVCDNGKGFLPEKVRKGLGLTNIRNRAELFNGSVKIKTGPGAGCTVKVAIPYSGLARL